MLRHITVKLLKTKHKKAVREKSYFTLVEKQFELQWISHQKYGWKSEVAHFSSTEGKELLA